MVEWKKQWINLGVKPPLSDWEVVGFIRFMTNYPEPWLNLLVCILLTSLFGTCRLYNDLLI